MFFEVFSKFIKVLCNVRFACQRADSESRKRFSEKPIDLVAFTNSSNKLLHILLYLFGLMFCLDFEENSYNQLPGRLSPDYKYLHARKILHQLMFLSQTIPYCIRYIIGVYCYDFKSQINILASY